jgi:hypothetical protein
MAWWQKIGKREARWNELKGEFNAIIDVALLLTLQMKQLIVNN